MARIDNNQLVQGARGNLGKKYVYKRRGDNTHIAVMPKINRKRKPTDGQVRVRDLFSDASAYAKGAINSPLLKKLYQKKVQPGTIAYNIAFRDYLKAPVVKSIDTKRYSGARGSVIMVKARDDFRVVAVRLGIYNTEGVLIEEGDAILNPVERSKWIYAATIDNASVKGCTIKAIAFDLPGNKGSLEVMIEG